MTENKSVWKLQMITGTLLPGIFFSREDAAIASEVMNSVELKILEIPPPADGWPGVAELRVKLERLQDVASGGRRREWWDIIYEIDNYIIQSGESSPGCMYLQDALRVLKSRQAIEQCDKINAKD